MAEIVELNEFFVKGQCYCLNQHIEHPFSNLFIGDSSLYLQSDVDEQLLLNLVFRTTVKINSIDFVGPHDETGPATVKLFVNLSNPGFADVEDVEPAQTISLNPQDLEPNSRINLKVVKFLHVNSLTIYIPENNGGEQTILSGLKIFGQALDNVNVAAIRERKQEG